MIRNSVLLLADVGVPMIFLTFPAMIVLLLPIIALATWLCRTWLSLDTWTTIKSNAVANVASTVVGVPVAWGAMFGFEMAFGQTVSRFPRVEQMLDKWHSPIANIVGALLFSAWLGPSEKNAYWMIPVATLGLLVPTYFLSVWIEMFIVDHMVSLPEGDPSGLTQERVRRAVRNANLVSYGLLAAGTIGWLFVSLLNPPH
jgi:hypothetical protein